MNKDKELEIEEILREVATAGEVPAFAVEAVMAFMEADNPLVADDETKNLIKDLELELLRTPKEDWRKRATLAAKIISRSYDHYA